VGAGWLPSRWPESPRRAAVSTSACRRPGPVDQVWTATGNCANQPTTTAGTSNIGGPNPYWESWTVDPTGLRRSQVQHALPGATSGDTTTTYTYPTGGSPQADTLSSTSTTGPSGTSTASYDYDANGNQLLEQNPTSTTLHLPGEELTYSTATKTVSGTRYYTVNGQTIAERTNNTDSSTTPSTPPPTSPTSAPATTTPPPADSSPSTPNSTQPTHNP
jgi:hypothetical protein